MRYQQTLSHTEELISPTYEIVIVAITVIRLTSWMISLWRMLTIDNICELDWVTGYQIVGELGIWEAAESIITENLGESTGEFPSQRPVTRSFDVFFDLRLKKTIEETIEMPVTWGTIAPITASSSHVINICSWPQHHLSISTRITLRTQPSPHGGYLWSC